MGMGMMSRWVMQCEISHVLSRVMKQEIEAIHTGLGYRHYEARRYRAWAVLLRCQSGKDAERRAILVKTSIMLRSSLQLRLVNMTQVLWSLSECT